jgi:hypothetical protein
MDTPNTPPSGFRPPLEQLSIYVPRDGALDYVAPASVIVGSPAPDDSDRLVVDFEGNTVHPAPEDKPRHEVVLQRLLSASGRHIEEYPTVARACVPVDDLTEVAVWRFAPNTLEVNDAEELDAWLAPLAATSSLFAAAVMHDRNARQFATWALTRPFGWKSHH